MLPRLRPVFQQQGRQFHRIYRIKKDEHKYSVIPLSIFVSGMITISAYRHRDGIYIRIDKMINKYLP